MAKTDASYVARAIIGNFDKLPDKVRKVLLLKLLDKVPYTVAIAVADNFDRVPDKMRDKLPLKLSQRGGDRVNRDKNHC